MKFLRMIVPVYASFLVLMGCAGTLQAAPTPDQSNLLKAAQREIDDSNATGNRETACSLYVKGVLNRAGYAVPAFMANEFDQVAEKYLPDWSARTFRASDPNRNHDELRSFLNALPNHTALFAQWPRPGRSGHVALIEKVADDQFVIYQAQQGRATPHKKATALESLLYSRNQWGDRSTLRLFVQH